MAEGRPLSSQLTRSTWSAVGNRTPRTGQPKGVISKGGIENTSKGRKRRVLLLIDQSSAMASAAGKPVVSQRTAKRRKGFCDHLEDGRMDNQKIIAVLAALNVASLCCYAAEYVATGHVVASSGTKVSGWHEVPATVAFLGFVHQAFKMGGWHALIGKVSILAAVLCLAFVVPNLRPGILMQFEWAEALKRSMGDGMLVLLIRVWNEAVNIHQFMLYGVLLLHQLYRGYVAVRVHKDVGQHKRHMQSATMFLFGPLAQRFCFNHLTPKRAEHAVLWQVGTYSVLMLLIDQSAARPTLRATLALALVLAGVFVGRGESGLQCMLVIA